MEQNKISIIIPVYNTKDYLEKCINSVIGQTYKNIEIILVNDTNSEGTKEICEKYKNIDSRIKLIEVTSTGVGHARNKGIEISTGEYIGFVDSDDYIEPDMFEILHKHITENDADIVDIGFVKEENGKREDKTFSNKVEILSRDEAVEEVLKDRKVFSFMWNKLYKKAVWNNLWFNTERVFEDIDIMYKLFSNANKVVLVDKMEYIYVQRSTSIMHAQTRKFLLDRINMSLDRLEWLKDVKQERISFMSKYAFIVNMIVIYRKIALENYDDIYGEFMKHYDLFMEIVNEYEARIREILTYNQNRVLDFMLENMDTAPDRIRNTKDIEK